MDYLNTDNAIQIPDNVNSFIWKCSKIYGNFQEEIFNIDVFERVQSSKIVSPIEQMLLSSLLLIQNINYLNYEYNTDIPCGFSGLRITPQFKIDKFAVDFFVEYSNATSLKQVIVECDSQQFHDRTERERRYEKMRERYLVAKGYKIFRYTGKEIIDDPLGVAIEIISYLSDEPKEMLNYYEEFLN